MSQLSGNEPLPVIWAISGHRLTDVFRQVAPEMEDRASISIIHRGYESALAEIERRGERHPCDVIVASGSHGAFLRRNVSYPVALVKVGGSDLLAALCKARQLSDRIAILMLKRIPPELKRFASLFSLPLVLRAYETAEEARHCLRQLASDGIQVVVGPGQVADLADEAGLTGVLVYSAESVRVAFDDAIEMAAAQRAEKSRRTQLDSILYHLGDGVVALDMAGRVVMANPAAEQLTGRPVRNALGRSLGDVLPALQLGQVITRGAPELGAVQELAGKSIVVDRVPLFDEGKQTGAVLTLHGSNRLELAVSKLRAHTHRRSQVARYQLDDVVSASPAMQRVIAQCKVFAQHSDAGILIHGESGTGKELLAQGIHNASRRARHPFIATNCGAFTETLLESELFGYDEGAFTGARKQGKAGLFEAANGGTLFLDEIGEMPLPLQTRLLRALQEKEIMRVGSVDPLPVDVRVVAATHRDLAAMVGTGRFREDLFYRLNILRVDVPPLRERPQDIEVLVRNRVPAALARIGLEALSVEVLAAVLPSMRRYAWPGNVRELENAIERLTMICLANGGAIRPAEINDLLDAAAHRPRRPDAVAPATPRRRRPRPSREDAERTLADCHGDHQEAARRLGVSRTTLWRWLTQAA
ncbi:propionate catabolism operon regulatory protein PrpR [Achromobacter aloeverae]|uniref:Propionate catabolism operon regulatory protein PrpR n=1 Tax=Achromobacter aloeverae TaxID=1750518 RepID=A0A4Q1HNM3_9BURK|nr:propionate catabolism operon regulatory protein PrpR [Achromobacter aloeverae]RXN92251.1 propionate catabolism operon regulatory protein PrpR [Achromobacter aloeverae]